MQNMNWYDLQVLAAVQRGGSVAAAARLLGIDQTTVSRRIAQLQEAAGIDLVIRGSQRRLALTPLGEEIAERALAMEREADAAASLLGDRRKAVAGTVRLTAVPMLVNHLLAPASGALFSAHPELTLELVPENRDLSLTRREADLALRLARPETGGSDVKARRIGTLFYRAYETQSGTGGVAWILYEAAMAHLPHARWLARRARRVGESVSGLRVGDAESALEAVAAGIGRSILPTMIADGDSRLQVFDPVDAEPFAEREVWLLSHAQQPNAAAIGAVSSWLEGLFAP
ncbi:LysR family transcriptional regulator [Nisaea sediminum]|uniref:LysR family transcriptional regulator n=1 Tax=Nisaea sediminum TaxID=2775867 RepID=UPI001868B97C|nr:LysR family transcriptional regulator [Nisaea sediminum]